MHLLGLSVETPCAGIDLYCIVQCGRKWVETPVIKSNPNPMFGTKVNFYIRNSASVHVTVEVSVGKPDVCVAVCVATCTTPCGLCQRR